MNNSKYLNAVLTAIALLLGLNLWVGAHQSPAAAAMDPAGEALAQGKTTAGEQRSQMIAELKALGTKVDAMSKKLGDGSVKVTVQGDAGKD
ncbi:MAG: hypothetical protein ACE37H_15805 [Phycisphaeraceae bacterium]